MDEKGIENKMRTVDVTVSATVAGKTEPVKKTVKLAILGENMADFTMLAQKYGSDEVKDDKGVVIEPSEKTNPILFIAHGLRRDIEYGRGIRNAIRAQLVLEAEGPNKTIDKTAKQLVASGLFTDETSAREFVVTQRKAKGLPV